MRCWQVRISPLISHWACTVHGKDVSIFGLTSGAMRHEGIMDLGFPASQPKGDRVVWGQPNWKLLQQKSPGESSRAMAINPLTEVPDAAPGPS